MPELDEGTVFAGHRIEGVAGRGGMGTVYRATHLALDHMVALKVIAADLAGDESFRERFKSESRIAVSLRHPNVVPIHHAGEEDGLLFVTMDLVDGPDLRKLLIQRGGLDPDYAVSILAQVAAALDVAHSRGLVHRDIKPGNVLIEERDEGDRAYLTDFGLTKRIDQASAATALTSTGAFVGTLDYVAPEQIRGEDLDARTDVYALGCVLYEMLTGNAPFSDREEKVAKMYAHLQDRPSRLEGRAAAFNPVVDRALAKQPDERYPSAGDLARAARASLEGGAVVEAERSVATGPAAPTGMHEEPDESTEEVPGPSVEPGAPAPPRTRRASAAAATEARDSATVAEADDRGAGEGKRRRTSAAIAAMLVAGVLVGVGVLLLAGGDDGGGGGTVATTTDEDARQRPAEVAEVVDGSLPAGEMPVGVAFGEGFVYAADREGGRVIRGEPSTLEPAGALELGGRPEELLVADGSVWVTLFGAGQVVRAGADLVERSPRIETGEQPSGIAAGGGSIWVANQGGDGPGSLTEIDLGSGVAEQLEIDAQRPHGIAFDGGELWVVDRDAGEVIRLDRDGSELARGEVGTNPKGIAIVAGVAWVANTGSGTVSLLEAETLEPLDEQPVGGQPRAVAVHDGRVWVSNGGEVDGTAGYVSAFDAETRLLLARRVRVEGSPEGLGAGGDRLWVATGSGGEVQAIRSIGG